MLEAGWQRNEGQAAGARVQAVGEVGLVRLKDPHRGVLRRPPEARGEPEVLEAHIGREDLGH